MLLQTIYIQEYPFTINIQQIRWDSETGLFQIIK